MIDKGYMADRWEKRNRPIDGWRYHNDHFFNFGKVHSKDYHVYITDMRVFGTPEKDVTFQSVAGRNGDITFDNKRMNNIDVVYSCLIPTDFRRYYTSFMNALHSHSGYQRLVDTAEDGVFRMAVVRGGIEPTVIRRGNGGTFDVRFTCKPQKFLVSGTYAHTLTETPAKLYNQNGGIALPLITVYGTGPGKFTINDITVDILALADQITLDCDLMTAYRKVGDAAAENKNADIYAPEFPVLGYDENVIAWDGGITHVDIVPRSWRV